MSTLLLKPFIKKQCNCIIDNEIISFHSSSKERIFSLACPDIVDWLSKDDDGW